MEIIDHHGRCIDAERAMVSAQMYQLGLVLRNQIMLPRPLPGGMVVYK